MQGMPRSMRGDLADHRPADQGKVSEKIEDLVAHELIAEAQRTIHHAALVEDDAILHRATTRQTCGAQLLDVAHEAERPCRSDLAGEVVVFGVELKRLFGDRRMWKVNFVLQ